MWCRRAWFVSGVLSFLLLVACAGPAPDARVVGATSAVVPPESSTSGATSTSTTASASDPSAPVSPADPSRLTVRPVLGPVLPCDLTDPDPGSPGTGFTGGTVFPMADAGSDDTCVEVGPVGLDGAALDRADAQQGGSTGVGWVVAVEVADGDRAAANALFNACFAADPTCPDTTGSGGNGQLAIVLDDEVISAPTVSAQDLAAAELVISGGGDAGFTRAEAEDLAATLSG